MTRFERSIKPMRFILLRTLGPGMRAAGTACAKKSGKRMRLPPRKTRLRV
jgi:hypothetical protein